MFIVKAVSWDGNYKLFDCERLVVVEASASVHPHKRIHLHGPDQAAPAEEILDVCAFEGPSNKPGPFRTVYVMNSDGRTVDTVHASRSPPTFTGDPVVRVRKRLTLPGGRLSEQRA